MRTRAAGLLGKAMPGIGNSTLRWKPERLASRSPWRGDMRPDKAVEVEGNLATWNPEKLNCSRPIQECRNSEIHNAQGRQAQFRDAWRGQYRLAHLVTMIWWRVQHKELRPPCTDLVMPPMGSRVVARVLF